MLPIIYSKFEGRNGSQCVYAVVDWRNIAITLTAIVLFKTHRHSVTVNLQDTDCTEVLRMKPSRIFLHPHLNVLTLAATKNNCFIITKKNHLSFLLSRKLEHTLPVRNILTAPGFHLIGWEFNGEILAVA